MTIEGPDILSMVELLMVNVELVSALPIDRIEAMVPSIVLLSIVHELFLPAFNVSAYAYAPAEVFGRLLQNHPP